MAPTSTEPDTPGRFSLKRMFSRKPKKPSSQETQGSLRADAQPRPTKSRTSLEPPREKEHRFFGPHRSSTRLSSHSRSNNTFDQNGSLPSTRIGPRLVPEDRRGAEARAEENEADTKNEIILGSGHHFQMSIYDATKQMGPKITREALPHKATIEKEKADKEQDFESDTATEPESEDELGPESEGQNWDDLIHLKLEWGDALDGTKHKFLPEGVLVKYLTAESVRRKLEEDIPSNDIDDLVTFIVSHARKIFATLLLLDFEGDRLCKAVRHFRDHRTGSKVSPITDSFLPITEAKIKGKEVSFFEDRKPPWKLTNVSGFCEQQWTFLAPKLPPKRSQGQLLKVDALTVLPFIEAKHIDAGAFRDVYRVMPCPSHIRDKDLKVRSL